jgi:hypothetical protein
VLVAARYAANATVVGYELMNEPAIAAGNWQGSAQAAVTALRNAGDTKELFVALPNFSGPSEAVGLSPFITDPANNFRYVCHFYPDWTSPAGANGGSFGGTYAQELAAAKTAGFSGTDTPTTGVVRYDSFTRADSSDLGYTEDNGAAPWIATHTTGGTSLWGVTSNQAAYKGSADGSNPVVVTPVPSADMQVDCDIVSGEARVAFRYSLSDFNSGLVVIAGSSFPGVWTFTGSSFAQIGTLSSNFVDGDHCTIIAQGTSITVKRNGATVWSGTSSFNATLDLPAAGLAIGANDSTHATARWDNFQVTAI